MSSSWLNPSESVFQGNCREFVHLFDAQQDIRVVLDREFAGLVRILGADNNWGQVFTTILGHVYPTDAARCIGFQTQLLRGCEWVATGKVTIPIPENFPTATEVSMVSEEKKN